MNYHGAPREWFDPPPQFQSPPAIDASPEGIVRGAEPTREIPRYAVILTHQRPVELRRAVEAVMWQADHVLVVDNASAPPVEAWPGIAGNVVIVRHPLQPPNLAVLWNFALNMIATQVLGPANGRWDVALLCDDVEVPPHWYDNVSGALRSFNASAASAHKYHGLGQAIVKVRPDGDFQTTM